MASRQKHMSLTTSLLASAAMFLMTPAISVAQQHGGGHPSGGGSHSQGARPAFGNWHPAPSHTTPMSPRLPAARPPQGSPPRVYPNGNVHGTPYYRGTTHYVSARPVNASYVRYPSSYPGAAWVYGNNGRWYNGYWHNYWVNANWLWFSGFYGFWFPLDGASVFVYEMAPGVCQYWDGYNWVPYYDPNTGYYCPY